jgi:hypothetical protein
MKVYDGCIQPTFWRGILFIYMFAFARVYGVHRRT